MNEGAEIDFLNHMTVTSCLTEAKARQLTVPILSQTSAGMALNAEHRGSLLLEL
ncbi:MAG: hypothetical protein ABJ327_05535 [Litoreibacter sp.]